MDSDVRDTTEALTMGLSEGSRSSLSRSPSIDRAFPDDASDVLLLGPMSRSADDHVCASCFRTITEDDWNSLIVSLTRSADDRLRVLYEHLEKPPAQVSIVSAVDRVRSSTTTYSDGRNVSVHRVDDPSNLTDLGITISKAAAEFEGPEPTLVCVHSLTALLQYVELPRSFRFINVLQQKIGGIRHYHMDAEAHDQRTVATLRPLFDYTVRFDAEGQITIVD